MAITERLALLITADGSGAVREMEKVGRTAERSLGSAEDRIDKMGGQFVAVGSKMMVGGAIVGAAMWRMGKGAADSAEQADWAARVFGEAFEEVDSWAKQAAGSAALSESAAHQAASSFGAILAGTGRTKSEIADMSIGFSQLAADMSSAKNVDLETSLGALQSALAGQSRPMRQFGVMLDEATLKQRALDMGLIATTQGTLPQAVRMQATYAEIMDQTATFQGNFADTADTVENSQRRMAAEWENLTDSIGQSFLPVMSGVVSTGSSVINTLQGFNDATGGLIGQVGTAATVIGIFGGGALFTAGKIMQARRSIIETTQSIRAFAATHRGMAAGMGAAGAAAGAAAFSMYLWSQAVDGAKRKGQEFADTVLAPINQQTADGQRSFEDHGKVMEVLAEQIHELGEEWHNYNGLQTTARNQVTAVRAELIEQYRAMDENRQRAELLAEQTSHNVDAALAWVTAQEMAGKSFADSERELAAFNAEQLTAAGVAPDAASEIADLGQEFVDAELAIEGARAELKEWADALRAQFDPLFAQADAMDKLADAQDKVRDAQIKVNEAQASGDPAALAEATRDLEKANRDNFKASMDLDTASRELAQGIADGSVSLDDARTAMDRWVERGDVTEQQAEDLAREFGILRDVANEIDRDISIDVAADVAPAWNSMNDLLVHAYDTAGRIRTQMADMFRGGQSTPQLAGSAGRNRRARGGPVWPGEPFLVGEEGPELVTFGRSGHVTPAKETKQVLSGGPDTVHVHVHVDGRQMADAVVPLIREDRRARV